MKYFMFTCMISVSLMSCSSSRNTAELNNLNGTWELASFANDTKPMAELFTMKKPELQLDVPNGRVSGNTGCNRMTGGFTVDGSAFRFNENLATTKMGCPGYDEGIFMNAINRVNRFRLDGNQLSLLQDSTLLMTFAKTNRPVVE